MDRKGSVRAVAAASIVDPLAEALAHAPADAVVLAVVETDPDAGPGAAPARLATDRRSHRGVGESAVGSPDGRFPGGAELLARAQTALAERLGLDGDTELRPLLGHPLVLWADDPSAERRFAAWVVRDGGLLGELLAARVTSGAPAATPDAAGHEVFTGREDGAFARRGPLLVCAPDLASLRVVLGRRGAGGGQWSPELLGERGLGLPADGSVARVVLDARALVARHAGTAGRLPWVAALGRAALTVTPVPGGLRVRARASTDAGSLAPRDVPITSGVEPPATRGSGRFVVALRDPRQTLGFAERLVDAVDPQRLEGLRQAAAMLARFARFRVQEELVDQLTGSATITSPDGRGFTLCAELADPQVTGEALERLGALGRFGGPLAILAGLDLDGLELDARGGGGCVVTQNSEHLVALAVIDGVLVASTDPQADLAAAARAPAPSRAPTAGALRAKGDTALLGELAANLPGFAGGVLARLGDPIVTARGEPELFDVQLVLPVS